MGRRKKYNTEEERKAAQREANKRFREEHPDYMVEWRKNNANKVKAYFERFMEEHPDYMAEWRKNNAEKVKVYFKRFMEKHPDYNEEWYLRNSDVHKKNVNEKRTTPIGRAGYMVDNYRRLDNENNRGECTLTKEWIVENIFTQPCHYCGETDWKLLGCDRIDNTKPHTPENVVPCCSYCNAKKHTTPYDEYMRMIGKIA